MPLTPETLVRHELAGLHAAVAAATNPDLVGLSGRVVSETRNTLVLASGGSNRRVPKAGTTFEFRLPGGRERPGDGTAVRTDEPAADRKAAGIASDPQGGDVAPGGDGATYVTVDGATLLSRPARRTEEAPTPGGDDRWR